MKSRTKISFRALGLNQLVAQALPVPALRTEREERCTPCVGDADEIKSPGDLP
jgi:hypothetical protein